MDDSSKVWNNQPEYNITNYHLKQYNVEYQSIKFIKNYLKDLSFNTIIDFGCGAGSLCFYLKQIIDINFIGIDISEKVLNIAKKYNKTSIFIRSSFEDISNKYDLTISNQVLIILSPNYITTFINKQFECSNKYVVIFSLFTDSELDINIKINVKIFFIFK